MSESYPSPVGPDNYLDRLVKYTPVESLLMWVFMNAAIKDSSADIDKWIVEWVVFAGFAIFTPLWIMRLSGKGPYPGRWLHMLMATISFVLWVAAIGGPFTSLSGYKSLYGALALMGFSLSAPLFTPPEPLWPEERDYRR